MTDNQKSNNMFSQKARFGSTEETNLEETNSSKNLTNEPQRETLQVMLIGSRKVVTSIIHYLHSMDYIDVVDWTPFEPCPSNPEKVMSILERKIKVR